MSVAKAMLTDTTLCVGCEECVAACKRENKLGKDVPRRWKVGIDDLSSDRFTTLVRRPGNRFVRKHCRHCLEPACVSACIVGAMQKTEDGPVIYDAEKCMGCRYCMMACPYNIPRYDWEKQVPYVRKCTLCASRVKQGKIPACVEACPEKASIFGDREALLKEAHRRIQSSPGKYVNKVFGESEVGGTSVLFISDIPLDFLAWKPNLDEKALPELTWAALSKVPPMILAVGGAMAGVWWITGRRMKLGAESRDATKRIEVEAGPASEPGQTPDEDEEKSK